MPLQLLEVRASVLMDLIVDKLKLMNYEQRFCASRKPPWARLHKFYFSMPHNNRNDQFLYFSSLVSWLLSLLGCSFPIPNEQDDPNTICTNIMCQLRDLGFGPPSWPPAKLKQGYGDAVCSVLDSLANLALEAQKFEFNHPIHTSEICADEGDGGIENILDDGTDELYVPSDRVEFYSTSTIAESHSFETHEKSNEDLTKCGSEILKLKIENVAYEFHLSMIGDGRDWRTHHDQAQKIHSEMSNVLVNTCTQLERIEGDTSSALVKLESREKFMNMQLESLVADYRAVKGILTEIQKKHKKTLENIKGLTEHSSQISEQLDKVKQTLIEKGNQISDVSPLIQIKGAIHNLKAELQEMEVQIGVLEHTLLQNQLSHNVAAIKFTSKLEEKI